MSEHKITYKEIKEGKISVSIGKHVFGTIWKVDNKDGKGYQYFPQGCSFGGDIFPKLSDCKKSLEAE